MTGYASPARSREDRGRGPLTPQGSARGELIEAEIEKRKAGQARPPDLGEKLNSVVDPAIIDPSL